MSKNTSRMIGLLTMLVSIFFLIGGLYLGAADLPHSVVTGSLVTGVVFYRIVKSE